MPSDREGVGGVSPRARNRRPRPQSVTGVVDTVPVTDTDETATVAVPAPEAVADHGPWRCHRLRAQARRRARARDRSQTGTSQQPRTEKHTKSERGATICALDLADDEEYRSPHAEITMEL
jgi:hypothetical protein